MKKVLKNILFVLGKADPFIVMMPILMMIFSLSAYFSTIYGNELIVKISYGFITLLFSFIPTTTISYVFKRFKHNKKKRNNLLKRMVITGIGTITLIIFYQTEYRNLVLQVFGIGGFIYFLFDYVQQGRLYLNIRKKPGLILNSQEKIHQIMETKCSRSVLFEYSKTLEHIPKWNLRLKMKTTGIRWWHLFPLSEKSLTEKLFGINLTQIFSKNSTIKK